MLPCALKKLATHEMWCLPYNLSLYQCMPVTHCVTCTRSMNSLSLVPSWRTHQWYVVVILGKLKSFLIDLKVEETTTTIAKIIMIIETHRERVQSQCWSEWEREKRDLQWKWNFSAPPENNSSFAMLLLLLLFISMTLRFFLLCFLFFSSLLLSLAINWLSISLL